MSLINQMLRDLEARQGAAATAGGVVAGLGAAEGCPAPTRGRSVLHWFVIPTVLAAAALAASYWPGIRAGIADVVGVVHRPAVDLYEGAPPVRREGARTHGDGEPRSRRLPRGHPPPGEPPRGRSAAPAAPAVPRDGPPPALPAPYGLRLSHALSAPVTAGDLPQDLRAEAARINLALLADPPGAVPPQAPDDAPADVAAEPPPAPPTLRKRVLPHTPAQRAERAYQRALAALQGGEPAAIDAAFARTLELWPDHVKARAVYAAWLLRAGRVEVAERLLAEGVARTPDAYTLVKLRARVLVDLGREEQALRVLAGAAPAVEADPEYHALRAALLRRAGHHRAAATVYRLVLSVRPRQAAWWLGLALSLEALGESDHARRALRNAAAGDGLSPEVSRFVTDRLARLGG